jgi:single-stranded-DNA-specific exonuclease
MKIKLIGDNNYFGDVQAEYFKNREIKNVELFKNLKNYKPTAYTEFVNMKDAIKMFKKHLDNKSKIGIIVDSDPDGYTSASLMYRFIKDNFDLEVDYLIHRENKAHGIFINEIKTKGWLNDNKINLLIVPDAGSEDYRQHKILKENEIDIIVLDHHPTDIRSEYAIVVNNQFNDVSPNLTGVGMVLKFIEGISEKTKIEIKDNYYNLTTMGLIGDSADTRDLDIQYYIQRGLKNIENKMILALSDQVNFSTKGVIDQESVGWYLVPLINGNIRYGNLEERSLLFECFAEINDERTFPYTFQRGEKKGETIDETLYQSICRVSSSLKARQDREIEKMIEGNTKVQGLKDFIEDNESKKVLVVDISDYVEDSSLTGVIANKLSNRYQKPILAIRKTDDEMFGGSGRGDKINHFKTKINTSNILSASGHESAFGIMKFALEGNQTLQDIEQALNEYFKDENLDSSYEVDFIIPLKDFHEDIIEDLYALKEFWGHGMSAPLIYLENVKVKTNTIKTNDKNTFMSFNLNYIDFLKFKLTPEIYENLVDWEEYMWYNILGKPFVSSQNGERKVGLVVQGIERINKEEKEQSKDDWEYDGWGTEIKTNEVANDTDDWNDW